MIAVNTFGESEPSKVIIANTIGRPSQPDRPSVRDVMCTSFLLCWTPPRGSLDDEIRSKILSYSIFFQGPEDKQSRLLSTLKENQLLIEDLEPSTQYHCSLTCTNPQGESDMSPLLSITTASGLALAPDAPTVSLEMPKSLEFTFPIPVSPFPITEYLVEHDMGSNGKDYIRYDKAVLSGAGEGMMKVSINNLEHGTTYRIRVAAMNRYGAGPFSKYGKGQTEGVPSAPEKLTCDSLTPVSASLSWTPPKTPLPKGRLSSDIPLPSYILYIQDASAKASASRSGPVHCFDGYREILRTAETCAMVTDLTHDTSYTFGVSAVNPQGEGLLCKTLSVKTENGCPVPPSTVTVDRATAHSVYISWKSVECHESGGVVEYVVEMSLLGVCEGSSGQSKKSPFAAVVATTATDVCVTDLDAGCIYTFRVSGRNSHGTGRPSKPVGVCTVGSPMTPTGLKAADISTQSLKLSWIAPAVVGYCPTENPMWSSSTDPINYAVEVSTDGGKAWQVCVCNDVFIVRTLPTCWRVKRSCCYRISLIIRHTCYV